MRYSRAFVGSAIAWLLFTGCGRDTANDPADLSAERLAGEVDESFGREVKRVEWTTISGIATSATGMIAVADAGNSRVTIMSPKGEVKVTLGGRGSGYGELAQPCCLAFDSNGELWVREGGNARYTVFRFVGDSAVFDRVLPIRHEAPGAWERTTFDSLGRLIDVGLVSEAESGEPVTIRFHRDALGVVAEQHAITTPKNRLEVVTVKKKIAGGESQYFFQAPFGPRFLTAQRPGGEWAEAVSSSYAVTWRGSAGNVLYAIAGEAEGPELSRAEKAEATKSLKEDILRAGRRLPFKVPDRKPPLAALFFDATGRLWVERNMGARADRIADIYDRGRRVAVAHWPVGINLDFGAVQKDFAIGVGRDDMDNVQLVRVLLHRTAASSKRQVSLHASGGP